MKALKTKECKKINALVVCDVFKHLIRWYCGKCKTEYTAYAENRGRLKAECPNCKENTDYHQIFELETLQVVRR